MPKYVLTVRSANIYHVLYSYIGTSIQKMMSDSLNRFRTQLKKSVNNFHLENAQCHTQECQLFQTLICLIVDTV